MSDRKSDRLRTWVLGTAATGLLWHSIPSMQAADNTKFWANKKSGAKPAVAEVTSPPRLLPPDTNGTAPASTPIRQVSDTLVAAAEKSEVQKQLEMLYQQDGREMPDLNFNLQQVPTAQTPAGSSPSGNLPATNPPATRPIPANPQSAAKPARVNPAYTQSPPRQPATPYPAPQIHSQQTQPVFPPAPQLVPPNAQVQRNQPTTADAQRSQSARTANPVTRFFKKLTGESSNAPLSAQVPVPPDFNNAPSNVPVANSAPAIPAIPNTPAPAHKPTVTASNPAPQQAPRFPAPAVRPAVQPPVLSQTPSAAPKNLQAVQQSQPPAVIRSVAGSTTVATQLPAPNLTLPSLTDEPIPLLNKLPPKVLPKPAVETPIQISSSNAASTRKVADAAPSESLSDFPNPFPDDAESAGGDKVASSAQTPAIAQKSAPVQNPPAVHKPVVVQKPVERTATAAKVVSIQVEPSVSVDVEAVPVDPQAPALIAEADVETEPNLPAALASNEDPFAVEAKDFVEPATVPSSEKDADPTEPALEAPPATLGAPSTLDPSSLETAKPALEATAPEQIPAVDAREFLPPIVAKDSQADKMQKVRERFGMKGLKGFCPVTLRDQRELVDAKPEFQASHRGQKFHFTSAQARDKFEANPLRYKPAAFGADVVALSRDKEVVEGTLDFAAWYKGRLYLFGSQSNYDRFVEDPVQYATLDGIE